MLDLAETWYSTNMINVETKKRIGQRQQENEEEIKKYCTSILIKMARKNSK